MVLTWIMFTVAISLSAVAAFYSIVGLAAIFSAAVWPIVIMGTILEVAKLTVTVWLHEYWRECKWVMKAYLVPAVVVLMVITSMGIFGFLSKAHIDQIIPTGDRTAQIALFDERIANERAVIENSRSLIKQMDDTVNGIIEKGESREIKLRDGRIIVRSPAELALQVRRSQAKDRDRLTKIIEESQAKIVTIQQERAPIAKEIRGLEAEVGPIKYVAALIYGDNPDTNLLERAVRWVIIILVAVFDPLAVMMLLAATESRSWYLASKRKDMPDDTPVPPEPADAGAPDPDPPRDPDPELQPGEPHVSEVVPERPAYLDRGGFGFRNLTPIVAGTYEPTKADEAVQTDTTEVDPAQSESTDIMAHNDVRVSSQHDDEDEDEANYIIKQAKALWKQDNPRNTLKEQRRLLTLGLIDHLPWEDYMDDPRIKHEVEFGDRLPAEGTRGEMFVLTSQVPSQLFKHNGQQWIPVDKNQTDLYSYNHAYIDYLISAISAGNYDTDLLTDSEREQIESILRRDQT